MLFLLQCFVCCVFCFSFCRGWIYMIKACSRLKIHIWKMMDEHEHKGPRPRILTHSNHCFWKWKFLQPQFTVSSAVKHYSERHIFFPSVRELESKPPLRKMGQKVINKGSGSTSKALSRTHVSIFLPPLLSNDASNFFQMPLFLCYYFTNTGKDQRTGWGSSCNMFRTE